MGFGKIAKTLIHSNVLEPIGPAVFLQQELLAIGEAARYAALALGIVRAVPEGDVAVADISEPSLRG